MHVFRDLVWVIITFKTTVPSAPALMASRTSHRSAGLADRGRWHCSRVSRVLPEHRGAYAVRSTRGLLRRFCAAFAALRGCCTSIPMSSNVLQRCGTRARRIHGFLAVFARHRRASIWACMVHAWYVEESATSGNWPRPPLSSVERQQPSGRRPEGCSHSITSSAACACTPKARILVVLYLSWLVMWELGGR